MAVPTSLVRGVVIADAVVASAFVMCFCLQTFQRALHSLDHGAPVSQLGAELLLGIFGVAELIQLGVPIKANVSAVAMRAESSHNLVNSCFSPCLLMITCMQRITWRCSRSILRLKA